MSYERIKLSNKRIPPVSDPIWQDNRMKELWREWKLEKIRVEKYRNKKDTIAKLKREHPLLCNWEIELHWLESLVKLDSDMREKIHDLVKEIRRENKEQEKVNETELEAGKKLKEMKKEDTRERKAAEALLMLQNPEHYQPRRSSRIAKQRLNDDFN